MSRFIKLFIQKKGGQNMLFTWKTKKTVRNVTIIILHANYYTDVMQRTSTMFFYGREVKQQLNTRQQFVYVYATTKNLLFGTLKFRDYCSVRKNE